MEFFWSLAECFSSTVVLVVVVVVMRYRTHSFMITRIDCK